MLKVTPASILDFVQTMANPALEFGESSVLSDSDVLCSMPTTNVAPLAEYKFNFTSCSLLVGTSYKGFVYVVGNYTGAVDGTLSPAFDIQLSASNSLLEGGYHLTAIPTVSAVNVLMTAKTNGTGWLAVFEEIDPTAIVNVTDIKGMTTGIGAAKCRTSNIALPDGTAGDATEASLSACGMVAGRFYTLIFYAEDNAGLNDGTQYRLNIIVPVTNSFLTPPYNISEPTADAVTVGYSVTSGGKLWSMVVQKGSYNSAISIADVKAGTL